MPRKKNNTSRTESGRRSKLAANNSSAQPPADFKPVPAPAAVLDQQKLQQLYSSMLKCQMLQRRLQEISPVQQIVAGREAVLAGALAHSRSDDCVVSAHNSALVGLVRGDSLNTVVTQLASEVESGQQTPTPGQVALTKGVEKAHNLLATGHAVLVFCGDDPGALALQQETLALAAKDKAPLVCFIEVTLSALGDNAFKSGKRRKTAHPQFPVIAVDAADVVAVFRVAQEAIRRARTGHGPSLVKCVLPDDAGHDPLRFIEAYLRRKKLWSEEWQAKLAEEFAAQLESVLMSLRSKPLTVF